MEAYRIGLLLALWGSCASLIFAREFTVLAYNVENLFDVDGVAVFDDYAQHESGDSLTYSRRKLLTKLRNTTAVLKELNDGDGPEIILFLELEADFTPETTVPDLQAFVEELAGTPVEAMLTSEWKEEYSGVPSVAWLFKSMSDAGLTGYTAVVGPAKGMDSGIAHTNAVFSKFPITEVRWHPVVQARDILEAAIDVDGHPLHLYVNHWKSGASDPEREPGRVQNAAVLRRLLDARLAEDPYADIVLGGDFNSHYNHSRLYPGIETGINDVLGAQGDELAIRKLNGPDLYDLWFELSPEARYSEVWRGRRGSLMHLMLTRGLYDQRGVRYLDGSFNKLVLPGLNADALGRPLPWTFAGASGGGCSDHFPVYARFTTGDGPAGHYIALDHPSAGEDAPDYEMPLGYTPEARLDLPDGAFLSSLAEEALGPYVNHLYRVTAQVSGLRPLTLDLTGVPWPAYAPDRAVFRKLFELKKDGGRHAFVVKPGIWRGRRQLVVEAIASE